MPIVSVIVPIYNGKKYIHRCIDSVLSQSFRDLELIIVDDGSTDGSEIICDEYAEKDDRVRVVHQLNGGVSNARNTGLNSATGDYIVFCDGDDYIRSDLLEVSLDAIRQKKADIASFKLRRLSINGVRLDAQVEDYTEVNLIDNRESFLLDVVTWKTGGWQACRSIFRRDIIENHKIRFCETCNNYAEDLGFTLEFLLYANKIIFIDEQLYIYDDMRESSMMNSSRKKCRINDVNEVSLFLYKKMRPVITEKALFQIHHQIILNEIRPMYVLHTKEQLKYWHNELLNIQKISHFFMINTSYFHTKYGKIKILTVKSQNEIFDRYLTDLNMQRLLFELRMRRFFLLFGRLKSKLIRK